MAKHATITRRAALSAATVFPVAALPIAAKAQGHFSNREFVGMIQNLHPNGGVVAVRALQVGAQPQNLKMIQTYIRDDRGAEPVLFFTVTGHSERELVVNARGALLHGRVL